MVNTISSTSDSLERESTLSQSPSQSLNSKLSQVVASLMEGLHPYQRTILGLLAIAYDQRISAETNFRRTGGESLRNLAVEIPGRDAYRLIELADSLDQGNDPLIELERFPQLIPPQTLVILRLAESEGLLGELYSKLQSRAVVPDQPQEIGQTRSTFGAWAEFSFLICIVAFFATKIFPEIRKILEEFGVEHGPTNRMILRVLVPVVDILKIIIPGLLVILVVLVLIWLFRKGKLLMSGLGIVGWEHPRKFPSIERLRFLAMIADMRRPLVNVLKFFGSSKAHYSFFPNGNKLKEQLAQGVDPWTALASLRVITSSDAKRISQTSPDTQAWLLRRIVTKQNQFRELRSVFWQRGRWFVFRCFMVFMTFAMSFYLFQALIDMINGLIQNEGR